MSGEREPIPLDVPGIVQERDTTLFKLRTVRQWLENGTIHAQVFDICLEELGGLSGQMLAACREPELANIPLWQKKLGK